MTSFDKCSLLAFVVLAAGCRPADVVAEVGGRRITQGDVREGMRLESQATPEAELDRLIERELLAAAATKRDLQNAPSVKARLKAAEREILAQALLDAEAPAADEKALRAEYDASPSLAARELEVAHIFIANPANATAEDARLAQSRATAAWARLLGGEAFEDVARAVSEDSATRAKGGALGVLREGQVDQALFDAAAALELGATSKPVATPFGFHILKAVTAVQTVKPPFNAVRGRLEKSLRDAKLRALKSQLEATTAVKRFPDALGPLHKEGT